MFNILTLNAISSKVNDILDKDNYNISNNVTTPNALLIRSFNMHEYDVQDSVIAIGRAGAGVNNIPLDAMTTKGVCVFNTPGANANAVKELVLASMIMAKRNIYESICWTQNLCLADNVAESVEKGKKAFVGSELLGKTIGVVGLGAIGRLVANMCVNLGMNVIGFDPYLNPNDATLVDSNVKITDDITLIYTNSDFISLHVPATITTKNSINKDTIATMKDGVVIINCARAELVNNADMIEATKIDKVAKYITDLPNNDLIGKKNIITIPHLGASTAEAEENCAIMVAKQLKDYLEDGNIVNSVNFPNIKQDRKSDYRAAIIYKNNQVGCTEFSQLISECGANVTTCTTATRGDLNYTIIEADTKFCTSAIKKLEGVIKVNKFFK